MNGLRPRGWAMPGVLSLCVRLCGGDRTIIGTDSDHRKAVYPMGLPVNNNFFRLTSCCIGRRVCVYEPYRRRISGGFVRLVAVTKHNRTQARPARAPHRLAPPATAYPRCSRTDAITSERPYFHATALLACRDAIRARAAPLHHVASSVRGGLSSGVRCSGTRAGAGMGAGQGSEGRGVGTPL